MEEFQLEGRAIGATHPCFIIAEAGVNHNGDLDLARRLVHAAKESGADCIKFQTFKAERVATAAAPKADYQKRTTDPNESQLRMLQKLELDENAYRELMALCRAVGLTFLSTPYSLEDAALLDALGVGGFKVASGQLVELPFLDDLARFGKPMILSTGMATLAEVAAAVQRVRDAGNERIAVLQCTTNYPSRLADTNLRAMGTIARATKTIVGYSDHTEGNAACLASVALGAAIVEKHFTLDRSLPGPDHGCSAEPAEFAALVRGIRDVEASLGSELKHPTPAEQANLLGVRRSIVAARPIRAGEKVRRTDFAFKRPATGLAPHHLDELVGRTTRVDLPPDTQVRMEHFE